MYISLQSASHSCFAFTDGTAQRPVLVARKGLWATCYETHSTASSFLTAAARVQIGAMDQWKYNDALSDLAGVPPIPVFIRDLHNVVMSASTHCMFFRPDSFRDNRLPHEAKAFEAARKACLEIIHWETVD
jgi:hypothetical protein